MAQVALQNHTEKLEVSVSSDTDLKNFISSKFNLINKNTKLEQIHKTSSLTGTHYTFSLVQNSIKLDKVYIRAHVNKKTLFYLQYNFNEHTSFEFIDISLNKEAIRRSFQADIKIDLSETVFALNSNNEFQKAFKIKFYNEANDVYLERIYFSETDFIEKDLKVHFAPSDTLLKAKVFLPDPLTSSNNEYGGNYQDAYSKDTTVLIINTIPNTGQSQIGSGSNSFVIHGVTISDIEEKIIGNNFSGSNVYFVFENIYFDADGSIIGYNTRFIDNVTDATTTLIIEDFDFAELNAERVAVEVIGDYSSSLFQMKNDFVQIVDFSLPIILPHTSSNNNFEFKRSHAAFEEINAFYHISRFHDYIESLGFTNLDPQKIRVDVHGNSGGDNSFFTSIPTPRIAFGDGGVDDAEDADVIIHEYTHGLSYFGSPNSNDGAERQALDEALGDYFSSTYSAQFNDFNSEKVFSWDGHNEFWDGRLSNSEKTYNEYDESKSIYFNAEIWSATLMDIYSELGREITDKIVLESMFYNVNNAKFSDAANNLFLADSLIFNKEYKCDIFNVLVERNFKTGFCVGRKVVFKPGIYTENTIGFADASGLATIYVVEENFENMDIWLSDAIGKVVYKVKNISKPYFELDSSDFNEGIYYLRIQTNNKKGKYKHKIIKH